MHAVYAQIGAMKKTMYDVEKKYALDPQIKSLNESVEWFKETAHKMEEVTNRLSKDLKKWKNRAKVLEVEHRCFHNQLRDKTKETVRLKS